MSTRSLVGYVLIAAGVFFAVKAIMGAYALVTAPPAPSVGTWITGALLFVGVPGVVSWGLIKYGKKWSA